EKKGLETQIGERDEQLNASKDEVKDSEELTQQIATLQQENESKATEFQEKMDKQAKDFAVETALRDAKAKNPKIAKNALDLEAITMKDGKLIGIDEQLKSIQESDAYLF